MIRKSRRFFWTLLAGMLLPAVMSSNQVLAQTRAEDDVWPFPCNRDEIPGYTAYFTEEPITIDGKLNEEVWQSAPKSGRFVDLISGEDPIHDTHVKVLWDEENLYIGFWLEEPVVEGSLTERNAPRPGKPGIKG